MKTIKVPEVIFALGDREQSTQSGVTTVIRPLYYRTDRMHRIADVNPDFAEPLMTALEAGTAALRKKVE